VFNVNQPPVAQDGTLSGSEDHSISGQVSAIVPDPLTGSIAFNLVSGPQHGTIDFQADGSFVFTPSPDFNGNDSFTFQANDGDLTSDTATFKLSVSEVNDAPVTAGDFKTGSENKQIVFAASDLSANDTPGPANEAGQHLLVTSVSRTADTHGQVSLADGQIAYTPDKDYVGEASFNYTVTDDGTTNGEPDPQSSLGTVTVNILSSKALTY
ncbi:hypothetical protein XI06_07045, partial [Bradyrhizobium sp. CCBAU 11434]